MYKCPNCGGEIEFLPSNGRIKCQYCGSEFSTEDDLQKTRKNAEEQDMGENGTIYTCSQCGASLYTTEDTGVTFCSFCGSQAFIRRRVNGEDNIEPDMIIPFKITKEQCLEIYRRKIRNAWFLPKSMKADQAVEKFRGIYMPCWIYSDEVSGTVNYSGWDIQYRGAFDEHTDYDVKVTCAGRWNGFVYDAASSFPDSIMREISPYDLHEAQPFNDKYMAGFYADIGNVPASAYEDEVKREVDIDFRSKILKLPEAKKYHIFESQLEKKSNKDIEVVKAKKGYLPVWFLANKNDRTGKMSYAVINGATGSIHADLPMDMKKFFLAALAAAVAAFIVLQFFTIKPDVLLIIVMILLGILMSISSKMLAEVFIHQHGLDDIGAGFLNDDPVRTKYNEKWGKEKTKAVKPKKSMGTFAAAILCFVGVPILFYAVPVFLGLRDLTAPGFVVGFLLFIIIKCGRSQGSQGLKYKRNLRLPFGAAMRSLMFPLIGIIIGSVIFFAAPARDIYYYAGVVLCSVMLCVTVIDFARKTNELSLRKPAQLGKRGGDEDEI